MQQTTFKLKYSTGTIMIVLIWYAFVVHVTSLSGDIQYWNAHFYVQNLLDLKSSLMLMYVTLFCVCIVVLWVFSSLHRMGSNNISNTFVNKDNTYIHLWFKHEKSGFSSFHYQTTEMSDSSQCPPTDSVSCAYLCIHNTHFSQHPL